MASIRIFHSPRLVPPSPARCNTGARQESAAKLRRRHFLGLISGAAGQLIQEQKPVQAEDSASGRSPKFYELQGSGGVKALDIRLGSGEYPSPGDKVAIHYYGRLAAKQGWRFDSTYDHKDEAGNPLPFVFTVGSGSVIEGLDSAVRSMKPGGIRRVLIPPSQGYQNSTQEPLPPNVRAIVLRVRILMKNYFLCQIFDRQRLFTTIFNPTRIANGEGSTLGTVVFDIELLRIMKH